MLRNNRGESGSVSLTWFHTEKHIALRSSNRKCNVSQKHIKNYFWHLTSPLTLYKESSLNKPSAKRLIKWLLSHSYIIISSLVVWLFAAHKNFKIILIVLYSTFRHMVCLPKNKLKKWEKIWNIFFGIFNNIYIS